MKYQQLTVTEREKIQEGLWAKKSLRSIAKSINRDVSTVSREIERNDPPERNRYTPRLAQERAEEKRKERGRHNRLKTKEIRTYVIAKLKKGWSPEQISGRMEKDGVGNISHEAIYQYIYSEVYRGGNGYVKPGHEDLRMFLRRKKKRRTKKGMRKGQRVLKPKGISIDLRSPIVLHKTRIGDWEGDSVESRDHKPGLNTLLERKTGLYLITRLRDKTSEATMEAVKSRMLGISKKARHTLTLDNGSENCLWKEIKLATGLTCYYAHPYHSWERGANENANGLLREYFPKKTDFDTISDEELARVEYLINSRPRKRLGWMTPLEAWGVAVTG